MNYVSEKWKRKFPRIGHLENSKSISSDDIYTNANFIGKRIVITEKLDGENTVMGRGYCHARSMDSGRAPWRDYILRIHSFVSNNIPPSMRICGENLYAEHSIQYKGFLPFYVFQITDEDKVLSWEDTCIYAEILGLTMVPLIYIGEYQPVLFQQDIFKFRSLRESQEQETEGYVIRNADEFDEVDFDKNIAKWVRPNHIKTDEHWTKTWKPNQNIRDLIWKAYY